MADPTRADSTSLSAARRAYEEKQAKKAGKTLDAWLAEKRKRQAQAAKPAPPPPKPKPKAGVLSRLLERARKPL